MCNFSGLEHSQLVNEGVLPTAVNPETHDIVHHVVFLGDRVEHVVDSPLLLLDVDLLVPEVHLLVGATINDSVN